jgi:endonuclease/exonuclease/phosphatase family metal-dependent hydrolase
VARLDRIMVTGDLQVETSGVHESAKAKRASDHFPIWAVLRRG